MKLPGQWEYVEFAFETIKKRNRFLNEQYPRRDCTDVPGLFDTPTAWVHVHCKTITVVPKRQEEEQQ